MTYALAQHMPKHGPLYWTGDRIAQTDQAVVTLQPAKAARWTREIDALAAGADLVRMGYKVVAINEGLSE